MSVSALAEKQKAARPMTVQVIKTKAEIGFTEDFASVEARLPGGDSVRRLRREAIGRFASLGLPHRRVEEWKYTDLRNILKEAAPLATGGFDGPTDHIVEEALHRALTAGDQGGDWILFSDGKPITANGKLAGVDHSLATVLKAPPAWLEAELARVSKGDGDGVTALNTAFMTDGLVLDIPDGANWDSPVHAVFYSGGLRDEDATAQRSIVTRNIIRVGRGAKVTLVESHANESTRPRHTNAVTQLILGDGAEVTHVKLTETNSGETHLANWIVRLGANATYRPFQMTAGKGLVRNEMRVTFEGQHSTFDLGGVSLGSQSGHTDTTLIIDHAVPHCTSRELYKTVLADRARGIFQGKVIVRPGAQKTDGKQMAQALMLSPDAEFDSKPELEIYADDVVCGHGSTSAEIDEDLLFYCRSRGIPPGEARAMLVESFIGEAIAKVGHEGLNEALMTKARAWLAAASGS